MSTPTRRHNFDKTSTEPAELVGSADASPNARISIAQRLFEDMLERIRTGLWPVGSSLPGERSLMKEFGVSRIAVREALSMLRSLGVLQTSHGRKSVVRRIGTDLLEKLFPLMLSLEGASGYREVFEARLAVEGPAAYLAAQRRTAGDLRRLEELLADFQRLPNTEYVPEADLEFHLQIARATRNPLFSTLMSVISRYVIYLQTTSARSVLEVASQRLGQDHADILEAIRSRDTERARVAMEAHLRRAESLVRNNSGSATKELGRLRQ